MISKIKKLWFIMAGSSQITNGYQQEGNTDLYIAENGTDFYIQE